MNESSTKTEAFWLAAPLLSFFVTMSLSAQSISPSDNMAVAPDLKLLLQSIERIEGRNSAHSHSFEVTRNYQVFRADDKQPTSEVTAQVSFIPPDIEKYKITQATGNPRGVKIVDAILARETESASEGTHSRINRTNYGFTFVRLENFGLLPEYVLLIVPSARRKT